MRRAFSSVVASFTSRRLRRLDDDFCRARCFCRRSRRFWSASSLSSNDCINDDDDFGATTKTIGNRWFLGHSSRHGRGVFALQDVLKNERIFFDDDDDDDDDGKTKTTLQKPISSHPTLWNDEWACYFCCGEKTERFAERFCSIECERAAEETFYDAEKQMNREEMEKYCDENQLKFPLMALRIAATSIQKSLRMECDEEEKRSNTVRFAKTRSMQLRLTKELNFSEEEVNRMTPEEAMMRIREVEEKDKNEKKKKDGKGVITIDRKTLKKYAHVADSLVHAHVDETQMFPSWKEEHSLLLRTLESCEKIRNSESDKQKIRSVFDIRWYADLTTRFHLNSFKIEYPKVNAAAKGDFRAMMERTLTSSIRTGASNGSAIYALGSMFNHSCAPNVNVAWPQRNHLIDFVAKENVKKGEQFTISYIDLNEARSLDVAKRRAQLEEAYGFVCECTRCVEETRNNNNNNNNNNA